jgi:hypothetical protein
VSAPRRSSLRPHAQEYQRISAGRLRSADAFVPEVFGIGQSGEGTQEALPRWCPQQKGRSENAPRRPWNQQRGLAGVCPAPLPTVEVYRNPALNGLGDILSRGSNESSSSDLRSG